MSVTVITRVSFDPSAKEELLAFNERSLPIIKRQPGLVRIRQMLAIDDHELASILEWDDLECHLQCMASPDFEAINAEWDAMIKAGKVRFELSVYRSLP